MMLAQTVTDRLRSLHDILRGRYPAVERIALVTYDAQADLLSTYASSSQDAASLTAHDVRLAEVPSLAVLARERRCRLIDDISAELVSSSRHTDWLKAQAYASSLTVPVFQGDELAGFLFFDSRRPKAFESETVAFLEVFADLVVRLYLAERTAARTLVGAVQLASQMGRMRDLETGMHLTRMAKYSRLIARAVSGVFGLDDAFVEHIHLFAPLHDIGKVGIPDSILLKPGPLDAAEWKVMRTHVDIGVSMARHRIDDLGRRTEQGAGVMLDVIGRSYGL